eukprot:3642269-Pleurochrysis_carterae.AAC.2
MLALVLGNEYSQTVLFVTIVNSEAEADTSVPNTIVHTIHSLYGAKFKLSLIGVKAKTSPKESSKRLRSEAA